MHTPHDNDYILSKLYGFTSLFNPGDSWKEEEQLDDLDEQDEQQAHHPDETRPATD